MCLANNIRYLRRKHNYSQDYIAEKLGYKSYTTIQKWEMGVSEPSIAKLRELADLFDVDINDMTTKNIEKAELEPNKSDDHYYLNDETRQIAQEIFEKPGLRSLFKAARDLPPERLKAHVDFIESLKMQEENNNDEGC